MTFYITGVCLSHILQLSDNSCATVNFGQIIGSDFENPQRVIRNDVENMFTFPNTLQTEHWAKVGSTEFGYGKNGVPPLKID